MRHLVSRTGVIGIVGKLLAKDAIDSWRLSKLEVNDGCGA